MHLLSIIVQQRAYKDRLHHNGDSQVKDYDESVHNLSSLNQVNIFQYTNILHYKNIARFYKKF